MDEAQIQEFWQNVIANWTLGEALFFTADRRIADAIGDGPTDLDFIVQKTGTDKDALRRLLNALSAHGIFRRDGVDRFASTPLSLPLRSDTQNSQRAYIALGGLIIHGAWTAFSGTMQNGRPAFDLHFGAPTFEYLQQNPSLAAAFAEGMTSTTRRIEHALVQAAPFGEFERVVDIGGSFGSLVRLLLAQRPSACGIVFDRPEIVKEATERWSGAPDAVRLEAVGGNFFESVPAGGDLYLMKQILHDWTDEQSVVILNNIRKAMAPGARLAIVEMVLPDDSQPHPGWMYDLLMMTMTGGRERTAAQFTALLEKAGYRIERIVPTASPLSVIEATAASR